MRAYKREIVCTITHTHSFSLSLTRTHTHTHTHTLFEKLNPQEHEFMGMGMFFALSICLSLFVALSHPCQ